MTLNPSIPSAAPSQPRTYTRLYQIRNTPRTISPANIHSGRLLSGNLIRIKTDTPANRQAVTIPVTNNIAHTSPALPFRKDKKAPCKGRLFCRNLFLKQMISGRISTHEFISHTPIKGMQGVVISDTVKPDPCFSRKVYARLRPLKDAAQAPVPQTGGLLRGDANKWTPHAHRLPKAPVSHSLGSGSSITTAASSSSFLNTNTCPFSIDPVISCISCPFRSPLHWLEPRSRVIQLFGRATR